MLSPEYLREMPNEILEMYGKLEEDIISDISRRITKDLELTATADYQISVLQEMGYDLKDINKEIQKTTNIASGKFEEIILDSSYINYENEKAMYGVGGKILKPMQPYMKQYIKSTIKQGQKDLRNITNTLGFVDKKNNFKKIDMFYKDTLNNATMKLGSGAFSYDAVVRDAVKTMADSGVRTIDYKSGRKYHIESAVRMTVRTASSQISSRISEDNAEMMGQDLMEVTAHGGARPSHAEWQGQIVSRSGENKQYLSADDIGHETVSGFKGVNCRHDWSPFFEGLSVRAYTDKELEELDNADFEYEGKEYNHYEATQKQRHIERQMSESKRKLIAYDKAGLKDDFTAESIKLKRQRQEYERFSKVAGIRPKHERHGVYGFDRSISAKSSWANRKAQEMENTKNIVSSVESSGDWRKDAFKQALKHGKDTGNECLMWFNKKGQEVFEVLKGTNNQVKFTDELMEFLAVSEKDSLICIHNHPSSSSFSDADLMVMNIHESIHEMAVVGHDGTEYSIRIGEQGKRYLSNKPIRQYAEQKSKTHAKYLDMFKQTGDQRGTWKKHSNEIIENIAKENDWIYERVLK